MERLTKEAVRDFIENRYPHGKILEIKMIDERETMAFVLVYFSISMIVRIVVDINSEGCMDIWSVESASFTEDYRRDEI